MSFDRPRCMHNRAAGAARQLQQLLAAMTSKRKQADPHDGCVRVGGSM